MIHPFISFPLKSVASPHEAEPFTLHGCGTSSLPPCLMCFGTLSHCGTNHGLRTSTSSPSPPAAGPPSISPSISPYSSIKKETNSHRRSDEPTFAPRCPSSRTLSAARGSRPPPHRPHGVRAVASEAERSLEGRGNARQQTSLKPSFS